MSSIGKIFLLLNFLLAGVFLGFASTALGESAQWKQRHDEAVAAAEAEKAALEDEASQLTTQLNAERTAKDGFRVERDDEKARADRNQEDLDAAKRANEDLRGSIAQIQETLDSYNTTISNLEAAKDAAVAEARQMERERNEADDARQEAVTAQRDAEEALRSANGQIANLERSLNQAQDQLAAVETKLQTLVAVTGASYDDIQAQPAIDARVLKVDFSLEPGLVALNVGTNQGVKTGYVFEVYDGATYKGQVRVESVHSDMCSALVTRPVPGTRISQGDSAATRLR